jgi:hypothetical protein
VNTVWCSSIDAASLQRDRGRIASGPPNTRRPVSLVAGTALAVISSAPVKAQQTPETISLPPVAVTAPATASLKTTLSPAADALPAETTTLGPEAIQREPIFSYGDIFRPLTGFDVSNYGQGGLGYGISLRGFTDAEHGRDIISSTMSQSTTSRASTLRITLI